MTSAEQVIEQLKARAKPDQLAGMARFGLVGENRLGVAVPEMRKIAKEIGHDQALSLALWQTGITDGMILASMVGVPSEVTEAQMESWVADFHSWDVCDQVCMNLFENASYAWKKVVDWSSREEEYVKRAAFALVACLAWHDTEAPDEAFVELLPLIQRAAADDRNMVKKAVSWALRNIGKRSPQLNQVALSTARVLRDTESKPARWIGSDAIRDLTSDATARRFARMAKKAKP